jgi:hypothetical protein
MVDPAATEPEPRPRPRRGCAVAVAVATGLFCGLLYWIFGVPFDGWSRFNERKYERECVAAGGTERFCECFIFQLKEAGLSPDEIDRQDGSRAGFLCGVQGEL